MVTEKRPFRRPPRDLDAVIDRRPVRNEVGDVEGYEDVSVMERLVEAIRTGASMRDAANRSGMDVRHLRHLRREGAEHWRAFYAGKLKTPRGIIEQKMRLYRDLERAETDAKMMLLAVANQLARGGLSKTEELEETDGRTGQLIKRVKRETTLLPDGRMVCWLLERKWPDEFNRSRLEVTGADGGPVEIDTDDALSKLRDMLDGISDKRRQTSAESMAAGDGHENGEVG